MEKRTLHAKVILVDRDRAFVGSFNFTTNSLTNNREMGLFLDGKVVSEIQTVFEKDWSESRVALGEK